VIDYKGNSDIPNSLDELVRRKFYVFENQGDFPALREVYSHSRGLPGFIFAICISGTARAKINLREYFVEKNTIIFIPPNFIVEFIEKSDDYRIKFIFYSFDFVSDIKIPSVDMPKKVEERPCLKLSDEQISNLLFLTNALTRTYENKNHIFREEIAKNILSSLRYEIASIYLESEMGKQDSSSRKEEIFSRFAKLVMKHNKQERKVAFYADKLCITPKYLSEVVKDKTKKTPIEWINDSVIIISKTFLKSTDLSIIQISEELNFPNPSLFCRYFKKYTGISPLKYRET
jgi:AraC-like DNA-binding protein